MMTVNQWKLYMDSNFIAFKVKASGIAKDQRFYLIELKTNIKDLYLWTPYTLSLGGCYAALLEAYPKNTIYSYKFNQETVIYKLFKYKPPEVYIHEVRRSTE